MHMGTGAQCPICHHLMMHITADMSRCPKSSESMIVMFYWPHYMGLLLHLAQYDTTCITTMDPAGPAMGTLTPPSQPDTQHQADRVWVQAAASNIDAPAVQLSRRQHSTLTTYLICFSIKNSWSSKAVSRGAQLAPISHPEISEGRFCA